MYLHLCKKLFQGSLSVKGNVTKNIKDHAYSNTLSSELHVVFYVFMDL